MVKKTVTPWKSKKTYVIIAPESFDHQEIGETLASDPERLKGRTVNISLGELMDDRSKSYMNLIFEVCDVNGDKAHTKFKKFFIPTGYLRSKVRKRTVKIDYMKDFVVGGDRIRVKIMVLSRHKISDFQKADIKNRVGKVLDEHASATSNQFIQQTLFGKVGTEIYKKIKTICPIMRVEVYEIELMR